MNIKILLYAISILCSVFAVSGLNINNIFKKNHIWESRFFIFILIFSMSYLLTNFLYDFMNLFS